MRVPEDVNVWLTMPPLTVTVPPEPRLSWMPRTVPPFKIRLFAKSGARSRGDG